ncbi:MAG: phosphotransferase family protein [Myxococcota bacterium]
MSRTSSREPRPLDDARLGRWLDEVLSGHHPIRTRPLKGGGSCEIWSIERDGRRLVLRRAPPHASSSTAHDVLREHRILHAIRDEDVRIARPVAACDDPTVAGAPFYVMEFVDGVPIRQTLPEAYADSPEEQTRALEEHVDALAEIHRVDWRACGLESLGRPEGYLERQVPRWLAQLDSYRCRELAHVDAVAAWLEANRPPEQPPALVHGDYKLDNVLFSPTCPAKALAVVDWEMASIGDPLVDLAWALIFYPEPGNALALGSAGQPGGFLVDSLPKANVMIERYARATGRDLARLDWYQVFSPWKLAIVLEGTHAKHVRGESHNPAHAFFGPMADRLLERAARLVEGGTA